MSTDPDNEHNGKNPLEWTVFTLSGLLVAGVVAFLIWNVIALEERPASFEIEIGGIVQSDGSSMVPLKVKNTGSATAAEVTVTVTARHAAGREEESILTIDFIPRGGTREARAVFQGPEKPLSVSARVGGYIEP